MDGFPLWSSRYPQLAVLQGDRRCLSIAAASVIAKVTRDGIMRELGTAYPPYGFGQNAGYGTQPSPSGSGRGRTQPVPSTIVCAGGGDLRRGF